MKSAVLFKIEHCLCIILEKCELWLSSHHNMEGSQGSFIDIIGGVLGQLRLRLSQDLAGDPKHIYKHKIRQESAPSRGS